MLYSKQTQLAIDNFQFSTLQMPPAFIHAVALIKASCAEVNTQYNLLDKKMGDEIKSAAMAITEDLYRDQFPVDVFQTGSGTSTNMNVNEVIASIATHNLNETVHPNNHVNMGQSSNDVIPSAIHLSASLKIKNCLLPSLEVLIETLSRKAAENEEVIKTGRTHLMDAMPITLGQEISGWEQQIRSNKNRILGCLPRLHEFAIGGTAVGTGVNTPIDFGMKVTADLSERCSIKLKPKENYFEALSCQDTALELSGHLKTLSASLMKISNDLRWMNSGPLSGLSEISLPELQPGSSIMPGKVNPVIPEAVAMVCAQVIGNDACITVAAQSGNFQLNVMLPVIAYNLLQSIDILSAASTSLSEKVLPSFEANIEAMSKPLKFSPILATALNPYVGYDLSTKIAKRAFAEGRPVLEVAKEMTEIDHDKLEDILNYKKLYGKGH